MALSNDRRSMVLVRRRACLAAVALASALPAAHAQQYDSRPSGPSPGAPPPGRQSLGRTSPGTPPPSAGSSGGEYRGSAEDQQACTNDVMRLCNQFVPNVPRIVACLQSQRGNLSPPCRAVFSRR